jgi:hypothetical protein
LVVFFFSLFILLCQAMSGLRIFLQLDTTNGTGMTDRWGSIWIAGFYMTAMYDISLTGKMTAVLPRTAMPRHATDGSGAITYQQ